MCLKMRERGICKKVKKYLPVLLLLENRNHNFAPELRETVYRKANV
jgi:hypothetical protein